MKKVKDYWPLARMAEMKKALIAARRVLAAERRSQFECFTFAPHRNTPQSYAEMIPTERAAIRRFDRAIDKINEALT